MLSLGRLSPPQFSLGQANGANLIVVGSRVVVAISKALRFNSNTDDQPMIGASATNLLAEG